MKTFLAVLCGVILAVVVLIGGCTLMVGGCTTAAIIGEAERQKERNATNQRVVGESPSPSIPASTPPLSSTSADDAADASNPVQQGDAVLRIARLVVENVPLEDFGSTTSKDKLLMISVELTNTSRTKIMNYRGWAAQWIDFNNEDRGSLKDDTGNNYKRVHFSIGTRVKGQVSGNESIYPNKTLTDILVFEPPTDACKYLVLELPVSAVGGKGMFRLRIQRKMWAPEEATTPPPEKVPPEASEPSTPDVSPTAADSEQPEPPKRSEPEPPTARDLRTWHDKSGGYTIEAEYLWHTPDKVCLRRADGKEVKVPMDRLSDDDVEWIKQQVKR